MASPRPSRAGRPTDSTTATAAATRGAAACVPPDLTEAWSPHASPASAAAAPEGPAILPVLQSHRRVQQQCLRHLDERVCGGGTGGGVSASALASARGSRR
eukprot:144864-Chlamydomonas_euryale.AAC.7